MHVHDANLNLDKRWISDVVSQDGGCGLTSGDSHYCQFQTPPDHCQRRMSSRRMINAETWQRGKGQSDSGLVDELLSGGAARQ